MLRPWLHLAAGLCGLAAFAAEQAPAPAVPPGLRFRLAPAPGQAAPKWRFPSRPMVILKAPATSIVVTDAPSAAETPFGVCSVPLLNAFKSAPPTAPMPKVTPPARGFTMREAVLPAPPCPESRR